MNHVKIVFKVIKENLYLIIVFFLFGVLCTSWYDIWSVEKTETIMAATLFVSIINLFFSGYIAVENAVEQRNRCKKRIFADYCSRFSNDICLQKVAEWIMTISTLDTNNIVNHNNFRYHKVKDRKREIIQSPTLFEIEKFCDFLVELNIQIKNEQIDGIDARKMFSSYVRMFRKVINSDNIELYNNRNDEDYSELLLMDEKEN
jgi:hypothetical protein